MWRWGLLGTMFWQAWELMQLMPWGSEPEVLTSSVLIVAIKHFCLFAWKPCLFYLPELILIKRDHEWEKIFYFTVLERWTFMENVLHSNNDRNCLGRDKSWRWALFCIASYKPEYSSKAFFFHFSFFFLIMIFQVSPCFSPLWNNLFTL